MNVILRGRIKNIVKTMVDEGYANSQSEAVRLAIVDFGEHYISEEELVNSKLDRIDAEIKIGKRKLIGAEEALGKYTKYLK
jgi:Arc/MetJ-type ribon-helix-helix transcriptional regulator